MAANMTQDGFACQLVPTGIRQTGEDYEILATAVFTPVPLEIGQAGDDMLTKWPSWMASHLRSGLGVRLRQALGLDEGEEVQLSVASEFDGRLERLLKSRAYKTEAEVLTTLDALWAEWFSGGDSFGTLRQILHDAATATAGTGFKDVVQQGSNENEPVPDVIAVPRADLGRKLAAARAQDLLTNAGNALAARASSLRVDRKDWIRSTTAATYAQTPWAKNHDATQKPAANFKTFEHTNTTAKPDQWTLLQTGLQKERAALDIALNGRLDLHRAAAAKYAAAIRRCIDETNPEALYNLLRDVSASTPTGDASQKKDADFQTSLNEDLALHVAATLPDHGAAPKFGKWMRQRWHMLQGMHALSRLVMLVADLRISLPREKLLNAARLPAGTAPGTTGYFELALESDRVAGDQYFTLTKFITPEVDGTVAECWPTSVEEWATVMHKGGIVQSGEVPIEVTDGVVDLEAWVDTGDGVRRRRFDVLTLDAVLAAEAEVKRQRATVTANEVLAETGGVVPEADIVETAETSNLRTVALQLFDRWRQATLVREFVSSCDALLGRPRIGARDLRIGFKVDAGTMRSKDDDRVWTSLTDRRIEYTPVSGTTDIEELLDYLVGDDGSAGDRRAQIDAAMVNAGARLLDNGSERPGGQSAQKTAFAEQTLVTWEGEPLGQMPGEFEVDAGLEAIPVHQNVELNQEGDRPLKLCFGGCYALGLREVLRGGCAMSLAEAAKSYAKFAYPANKTELLRYLRHERVGGPLVAIDQQQMVAEFASERRGLDGKLMVVRSVPEGDVDPAEFWRFQPGSTSRIIFAPPVEMKFASRHGALGDKARRAGGLQDIDYDADWGGFPVFDPKGPAVLEAVRGYYFPHERQTTAKDGTIVNSQKPPSGIAAVRPRVNSAERKVEKRYYPDPAARYIVIALRRANEPNGYLSGEAIRVPFYPQVGNKDGLDVPGYPDARPVVLTLKRHNGEKVKPLSTYGDLRDRAGVASDGEWGRIRVGRGVAINVVLELAPGEDYEIETWCVPGEMQLRAWFDLPEGVAHLRQQLGDNNAQIIPLLPFVADSGEVDRGELTVRRGDATMPFQLVRDTAKALHTAMLSRPLPEIASVRRLRAVHATGLPARKPVFASAETSSLSLLRVTPPAIATSLASSSADWDHTDYVDGGRELFVGGKVAVDQHTTEAIELRVQAIAPRGEAFDDVSRGRSAEARARGIWPRTRRDETGRVAPVPMGTKSTSEDYMRELFGFDVAPDGQVEHRQTDGLLARWPVPFESGPIDLHEETKALLNDNRASPIERLFPDTRAHRLLVTLAATSRTARLIPDRSVYPDAEERQLDEKRNLLLGASTEIMLRATERPVALNARSLLPAFTWVRPTDGPAALERKTKIRVRLRRPWWTSGEDERLGIVVWPPNLNLAKDDDNKAAGNAQNTKTTKTAEGDWNKTELEAGNMLLPEPIITKPALDRVDMVEMAGVEGAPWRKGYFTDADLGPGGPYTTRWGADPIHAAGALDWFMSSEHFADLDMAAPALDMISSAGAETAKLWPTAERHMPRYVQNVLMPIPENDGQEKSEDNKDDEADKGDKGDKKKASTLSAHPQFMLVSLITYEPRFDPDFEHWYVDIEIDSGENRDPFVRLGLVRFQPHAERHLQVSAPEVKWVQVVSYNRRIDATRVTKPLDDKSRSFDWAHIVISNGDVSDDAIPDQDQDGVDQSDRQSRPNTFVATLIAQQTLPTGQVTEHVAYLGEVDAKALDLEVGNIGKKIVGQTGTAHRLEIDLPLPVPPEGEVVSYSVLVEEVQVARRSSFSNEPVMGPNDMKPEEKWIDTGARFAVRIDVPQPAEPVPHRT